MDGSYGDGMMDGSWGFWMMAILGLLLLAMIGLTAFLAVRGTGPRQSSPGHDLTETPSSAREMLDQRLARGEISQEDYTATRTLLDS